MLKWEQSCMQSSEMNFPYRNGPGETPFHLAAGGGHKELVEELIGVNKSCIELEDDKVPYKIPVF